VSRDLLRRDLKADEGTGPTKDGRVLPYWDCCGRGLRATCPKNLKKQSNHEGRLTVGYGRNLEDNGLSFREADLLLDNDIDTADRDLVTRWPWVEALDTARHAVLTQMSFNLGVTKLAGFVNTLKAIRRGDFAAGAVGMLASKWAEDVGKRARRLAEQMETGIWK
jgi:lysozyme